MLKKSLILCAVGLLASMSMAQLTLPRGYETMGGGRDNGGGVPYPFDRGAFRYQEVHTSWRTVSIKSLTQVQFRRAWSYADNTTGVKRTATLTFLCSYADSTKFTTTFTTNYITPSGAQAPTTVFTKKQVNMPDWQKAVPNANPQPWTLTLKFDGKFLYLGKNGDFLWESVYENPSVASPSGYQADRSSSFGNTPGNVARVSDKITLGRGCQTNNGRQFSQLTFSNAGPKATTPMTADVVSFNNPPGQPVTAAVGLSQQTLQIPGWCTAIYINPTYFVPLGKADSKGNLPTFKAKLPYFSPIIYFPLWCQTYAPDKSRPGGISLSNGSAAFMPQDPGNYIFQYTYTTTLTNTVGVGPYTAGSVITGWK